MRTKYVDGVSVRRRWWCVVVVGGEWSWYGDCLRLGWREIKIEKITEDDVVGHVDAARGVMLEALEMLGAH